MCASFFQRQITQILNKEITVSRFFRVTNKTTRLQLVKLRALHARQVAKSDDCVAFSLKWCVA